MVALYQVSAENMTLSQHGAVEHLHDTTHILLSENCFTIVLVSMSRSALAQPKMHTFQSYLIFIYTTVLNLYQ